MNNFTENFKSYGKAAIILLFILLTSFTASIEMYSSFRDARPFNLFLFAIISLGLLIISIISLQGFKES